LNKPDIFSQSGFSREEFLRDYWQKQPLVLRRAVRQADLAYLPGKGDLMKLAERDAVQSRIVVTEETSPDETNYHVEYGPFEAHDWHHLPQSPWTLLVSDVEKWLPSHRRLLGYFPFIRTWQFDDLMFSYATRGASVGAHTDHYDVFLLQVSGSREWQFAQQADPQAALRPDSELKLLKEFRPDHRVTLEAGDLLYLPAEVAHHGIAIDDDCVTCSVGLRAPAEGELLSGYFEDRASAIGEDTRFSPPIDQAQANRRGEITPEDINRLRQALQKHTQLDDARLANWFGRFITQYRNLFYELEASETPPSTEEVRRITQGYLNGEVTLMPDPFARLAWRTRNDNAKTGQAELFVNGQAYRCGIALATALCDRQQLDPAQRDALDSDDHAVIKQLLASGEIRPK